MLRDSISLFVIIIKIVWSFPHESLIYDTNPTQRVHYQYNDDGSLKPIKFKLQTASFKVYEQLPGLHNNKDIKFEAQEKMDKTQIYHINNDDSEKYLETTRELEKKYENLSRFVVFYNTETDNYNKSNITSNKDALAKASDKITDTTFSSIIDNFTINYELQNEPDKSNNESDSSNNPIGLKLAGYKTIHNILLSKSSEKKYDMELTTEFNPIDISASSTNNFEDAGDETSDITQYEIELTTNSVQ